MFRDVFFGWRVVAAAFFVAVFGWGVSFYGPPIFLHVIHETRGWSISVVSAAITSHYLIGAAMVVNSPKFHARFGLMTVTLMGGVLTVLGFIGWALATEPWHLFIATIPTGLGWATTGGAAVNAIVTPWFIKRRPVALSMAYNGASVGGIVFSTLWVALIASWGFAGATLWVGAVMSVSFGFLGVRYLGKSPADLGLLPDGDVRKAIGKKEGAVSIPDLPGAALHKSNKFITLALGMALGLFAQIGLLAHLYSFLVPTFGEAGAGYAMSYATVCAIIGRTLFGWLMSPNVDRRFVSALSYGIQILGCVVLFYSTEQSVLLMLLGVALFGSGIGNATSLPALIAQVEFAATAVGRTVALRPPVRIKYPTMRALKRRASKARGWTIPLSIRPPRMAGVPNDCREQSWPTDEQHCWRGCSGGRMDSLFSPGSL